MTTTNNHISADDRVQGLIDHIDSSPENFEHLQVFLHRERQSDCQPDLEFLMVTPTSFGKIELLNVSVEANYVILEIKDCLTQLVGNVRIDISDASPKTFFIRWQDIKQMVLADIATNYSDDEILEFDF